MSTTDDRTAIQTRMALDEHKGQNMTEHDVIRHAIASLSKDMHEGFARQRQVLKIAGLVVSVIVAALPVGATIAQASSTPRVVETCQEATRQEFERLREKELSRLADDAAERGARKALDAVTIRGKDGTR